MSLSNASRWAEICEIQTSLMLDLADKFPQRREQLQHIADGWQSVKKQAQGQSLNGLSTK